MVSYRIFDVSKSTITDSSAFDLYQYRLFVGKNSIHTKTYNSYWYIDNDMVISRSGDGDVLGSNIMCVEVFGYTPEARTSTFLKYTDLPYINGCSTKQLLPPVRPGDPTWQMLFIPENTSEQAHHIHSTTRIVYVLAGKGKSHIGTGKKVTELDLYPGQLLVLDKMIPHHFSTTDSHLLVLPLHIFSSVNQEFDHPMFNGTHKI